MVKATKATSAKTRTRPAGPRRPARRPEPFRWVLPAGAVVVLLAVGAVAWAINRDGDNAPTPVTIDHVHGLGVNPADGLLYAAALRFRHDIVYGLNSTTGALMVSHDRASWENRSTMAMRDFAVSPTSPDILLATTQAGLVRSSDGGRTWASAGRPGVLLLAGDWEDLLWALTAAGDVIRSTDAGATWASTGRVTGGPTAFAATGDDLYVSVNESGIFHSRDAGTTWARLYP